MIRPLKIGAAMAEKRAKPAKGPAKVAAAKGAKKAAAPKKTAQRATTKTTAAAARKRPPAKAPHAKSAHAKASTPGARKATPKKVTRAKRPAGTPARMVAPEPPAIAPAQVEAPAPARAPEPPPRATGPRAHPDSGLTATQVSVLHRRLLEERDRVLTGIRRHVSDATQQTDELAEDGDMASRDSQQSYLLRLADKERKLILEIEEALRRLQDGEYGICEGTEEPIGFARLQVRPWTRYSVGYKELLERQGSD
jgi:DnaK suppressor protein